MFVLVSLVEKDNDRSALGFFLLASLFAMLLLNTPGMAKTLPVPESSPTIKGALIKAQPGDIVLVSCGTYYEHDINMKPGVALWSGTLQPGCVTIDAQGKGRIFNFSDADTNTALVGFTLLGGVAQGSKGDQGGAVFCQNSSPRISNCVFESNSAKSGGAVFSDEKSAPVLTNCLFKNNEAQAFGGAVHFLGSAQLRQCAFEQNAALMGGAINLASGAKVTLSGCSLRGNSAGNTGGALHLQQAQCEIRNTIFSDNWGGLGGNALSCMNSDLKILSSTLYRNSGDTGSGVLALSGQLPQIQNSIIAFSKSDILKPDSLVPDFQGCNLFGNETGDWVTSLRALGNKNGNISRDPQFCAPEYGNFNLQKSSACLPDNNPSGNKTIVGAFGPGCASIDVMPNNERGPTSGSQPVQAGL
jgi:predicted outer membrane repeat protein